jgi:hypothetical protein
LLARRNVLNHGYEILRPTRRVAHQCNAAVDPDFAAVLATVTLLAGVDISLAGKQAVPDVTSFGEIVRIAG